MPLKVNSVLNNRYYIEQVVATGGMGSIYSAVDKNLNMRVAVKENLYFTDDTSKQFMREATILAGLRHPNLPRVTDHFVLPGQGQYLVMDHIDGEDVKDIVARSGAMLEDEAILIAIPICDALTYLHNLSPPIVHRDIKPGNIRLSPDKQVFLVDFGLAKIAKEGEVTEFGAQAVTPGYSSPEQYGEGTTALSDVYSLGATFYTILTGEVPEDGLARALGNTKLTSPKAHNLQISEKTALVIDKAMEIQPEDRYQSAEEFKQALLNANTLARQKSSELDKFKIPAPMAVPVTKPLRRRTKVGFISAIAVALVVSLMALGIIDPKMFFSNGSEEVLVEHSPTVPLTNAAIQNQLGKTPTVSMPSATEIVLEEETSVPVVDMEQPSASAQTQNKTPTPDISSTVVIDATKAETVGANEGSLGQVAFASDRSGTSQIWMMDAEGNVIEQLTDVEQGACQPTWNPDGSKLLFVSPCENRQKQPDSQTRLFVYDIEKDEVELFFLASEGGDFDPEWSPDGSKVAFISTGRSENDQLPHIYIYDIGSNEVAGICTNLPARYPTWSNDNQQIAFEYTRPQEIWLCDANDGDTATGISTSGIYSYAPDWSGVDNLVAFGQSSSPYLVKKRVGEAGYQEEVLDETLRPVRSVDFSPDGNWLLVEVEEVDQVAIYLISVDGREKSRLTSSEENGYHPAWRPRGF